MNSQQTKSDVLDGEFLAMRAKLLELAAALDRIDRAPGNLNRPERRDLIRQGLNLLLDEPPLTAAAGNPAGNGGNRAEQLQLLFSRAYSENWRDEFKL